MTIILKPDFLKDDRVYKENGKWVYDEDAPSDIKKKVDEFNKKIEKNGKEPLV
ncbi:hypothetical protein [Enterococcus sp. 2201sp1_2201st1_B8_2201SCRN_220225]|uniref:hypothetical protein n=1 Tax=unclassified Enterococcus TaxID=2608891 RepID=UPI0034A4034F